MKLNKVLLSSMTLVGLSLGAMTANATLVIVSGVGGAPTAGVTRINFNVDDSLPAGVTLTLNTNAALVTGSVGGQYAAPFLSGNNGNGFATGGGNQANGVDLTQYVTTGSTGSIATASATLAFDSAQKYLGLLWGSVDTYNTVEFFLGNLSRGKITGSQVTPGAVGNQGEQGTFYVNINSDLAFDTVVFTSSQFAFEFDNVAFGEKEIPAVPIPAAAWLLGSGLMGLFGLARRRVAS